MMRRIKLLLAMCLPLQCVFGADLPNSILFFCNADKSEFSFSVDEQSTVLKKPGFNSQKVNWSKLLQLGPDKNGRGQPLKSGSKIAVRQCGMIQIRIESGFINDDPQGESGALDFRRGK